MNLPVKLPNSVFSVLLLVFWTAIGLAFRMIDLTALPPWTDECATIAFSAGHGFRAVPTDQLITTAELTAPLWFDPSSSARDVWHFLRTESTHPPLYFFLAHYWMRLWSPVAGFSWESREALLWLARSLPALLGAASIPAMFGLARLAWGRSVGAIAIAQLAAALMAVSPFAISLAREARHYTLVLLFVIGSIACTIAIVRNLSIQTLPTLATNHRSSSSTPPTAPYAIALAWGLVNACGMATHYFFGLTLAIEAATVFSAIGWWGVVEQRWVGRQGWSVLITAAIPTMIGVIVWIPAWQGLSDNTLTDWVYDGTPGWDAIFRLLSWLTAMFFALPTDDLSLPLGWVIANGLVLLALFLALVRWVTIGMSAMVSSRSGRCRSAIAPTTPIDLWTILGLVGFGLAAILTLTFGFQSDLTLAIRFSYPYFPALVLLVAIGLGQFWQRGIWQPLAIVLIAGVVGATTTMFDLTYLQHHRPDRMAAVIADRAELPVVLATRHKHHGQTGRLIGVAWELGRLADRGQTSLNFDDPKTANVRYLLARYADHNEIDPSPPSPPPTSPTQTSGETLRQVVLARSTAIEVWPLNFRATIDWDGTGCEVDRRDRPDVREYDYRRFICPSGRR